MKKYISGTLLRSLNEGEKLPLFYFPVIRQSNRDAYECWILPLAPFVLLYYITKNVFWSIWTDLMEVLYMLEVMNRKKKR